MSVYKMRGRRYLKKYTSAVATPVYAAATDAQAIVDGMCAVPWTEVDKSHAQMSYHTNEMLDRNVEIRDSLDAAAFCAEHVSGMHRAYANAACYVFELPEMAAYPTLTAVRARVVSDPYNSGGVRLAVHVADSLDIPVDCAIARTGVAYVEGVSPREERVAADKKTYWYAATEEVEISVAVQAKRYLFLVVALEDYSRSRGDWLEGSAYILPTVEIETDGELSGWSEGSVNVDVGGREFVVREPGSIAFGSGDLEEAKKGMNQNYEESRADMMAKLSGEWYSATPYRSAGDDGSVGVSAYSGDRAAMVKELSPGYAGGVQACYAAFMADAMWPTPLSGGNTMINQATGAGFCVGWDYGTVSIARRRLLVPVVAPVGFRAKVLRLTWDGEDDGWKQTESGIRRSVWLLRGKWAESYRDQSLKSHKFFDASASHVGDWELLTSFKDVICNPGSVDVPVEIDSHGPHSLMLTTYIDMTEFDLDGEPVGLGTGYGDISATFGEMGVAIFAGAFHGSWDPKISLIG